MDINKNASAPQLYHGSNVIIQHPDIQKGRLDVDFGQGFYLTGNLGMASKWACHMSGKPYVNIYTLDQSELSIKNLKADKEWLNFVARNRTGRTEPFPINFIPEDYDIIIGPVADDRLSVTLDLYYDGMISAEKATKIINCMGYGSQIVLKTSKAVQHLSFFSARGFSDEEKQKNIIRYKNDGREAAIRTAQMMREIKDIWLDQSQGV